MEEGEKRERNEEGEERRKRMGKWRGKETQREGERGRDGVSVLITVRHIQPQNYIISLPPLTKYY